MLIKPKQNKIYFQNQFNFEHQTLNTKKYLDNRNRILDITFIKHGHKYSSSNKIVSVTI